MSRFETRLKMKIGEELELECPLCSKKLRQHHLLLFVFCTSCNEVFSKSYITSLKSLGKNETQNE